MNRPFFIKVNGKIIGSYGCMADLLSEADAICHYVGDIIVYIYDKTGKPAPYYCGPFPLVLKSSNIEELKNILL